MGYVEKPIFLKQNGLYYEHTWLKIGNAQQFLVKKMRDTISGLLYAHLYICNLCFITNLYF